MKIKLPASFRAWCAYANHVQLTEDYRPTWREVGYALWFGVLIQLIVAMFAFGIVIQCAWLVSYLMPATSLPSMLPPGVAQ